MLIDTHVLVWLYTGARRNIPTAVQARLEREQLLVSPFVQLELDYMYEVGRVRGPAADVLDELGGRLALTVVDASAAAVCRAATKLTWTRDPFDRLLAAHATIAKMPLVTRDESLRRHLPLAWWAD